MDVTWDFQPPNSQFYFTTSQLWNSVDTTILSGHFLTILLLVQGRLYIRKKLVPRNVNCLASFISTNTSLNLCCVNSGIPEDSGEFLNTRETPASPNLEAAGSKSLVFEACFHFFCYICQNHAFVAGSIVQSFFLFCERANWAGDSSLYSYLSFGCWGHVLPVETPRDERRRGPIVPPCQRVSRLASHLPVAKHVSVQDWKPPHKIIVQPGAGVQEVVLVLVPRVEVVVRRKLSPPRCFAHLPVIRIKVGVEIWQW